MSASETASPASDYGQIISETYHSYQFFGKCGIFLILKNTITKSSQVGEKSMFSKIRIVFCLCAGAPETPQYLQSVLQNTLPENGHDSKCGYGDPSIANRVNHPIMACSLSHPVR